MSFFISHNPDHQSLGGFLLVSIYFAVTLIISLSFFYFFFQFLILLSCCLELLVSMGMKLWLVSCPIIWMVLCSLCLTFVISWFFTYHYTCTCFNIKPKCSKMLWYLFILTSLWCLWLQWRHTKKVVDNLLEDLWVEVSNFFQLRRIDANSSPQTYHLYFTSLTPL